MVRSEGCKLGRGNRQNRVLLVADKTV